MTLDDKRRQQRAYQAGRADQIASAQAERRAALATDLATGQ
jgi:hypothetical protein